MHVRCFSLITSRTVLPDSERSAIDIKKKFAPLICAIVEYSGEPCEVVKWIFARDMHDACFCLLRLLSSMLQLSSLQFALPLYGASLIFSRLTSELLFRHRKWHFLSAHLFMVDLNLFCTRHELQFPLCEKSNILWSPFLNYGEFKWRQKSSANPP